MLLVCGVLKLNIDVAMDFVNRRMGVGWVIRDSEGVVKGVVRSKMEGLFTVREAEAMGVRKALSWIKSKGWSGIIVETDAQVVATAVKQGENINPFGYHG